MTNSDVYSFGVVPYEIITGRRTIIERMKHLAEKILVKWVKLYHVEETDIQKTKREIETNIRLLWSGELLNWLIIV
ncbi:BnaC07g34500D [Brassica napus]|uniref:BnaC07g34500D protein n=1 Tax=Brassica napus TaxID=3708 RepID=A0A078F8F5_BRANA|nr:BnaC07g34500D [Brassica napus]